MAKAESVNPARSDNDHHLTDKSDRLRSLSSPSISIGSAKQQHIELSFIRESQAHHLLSEIRRGSPEALGALSDLFSAELLRLAQAITGSIDAASDVVQDVFIEIWSRGSALEIYGSVRGYLWTATRNRARKVVRHEIVEERYRESIQFDQFDQFREASSTNSAPGRLDAEELTAQIHLALKALPPRCREIFLLRWRDDMTVAEIAEIYEIGLPTVRNQIGRAVKHLASVLKLDDREGGDE